MSTENAPSVPRTGRPPRGAMRLKLWALAGFVMLVIFVSFRPRAEPFSYIYLVIFSAITIAGALYECWQMWTLNARRSPRWIGYLGTFGSAGIVLLLLVLHDLQLFRWNHVYFEVPVALFCAVTTAGAWFTEWRKCVRIYAELEGFVFMPNAKPSNPSFQGTRRDKAAPSP